jgi:hypothetical protein
MNAASTEDLTFRASDREPGSVLTGFCVRTVFAVVWFGMVIVVGLPFVIAWYLLELFF